MSTRRGDGQPPSFIVTGPTQPFTATDGPHFAHMFHGNGRMTLNNVKVTNTADNTHTFTNTPIQQATGPVDYTSTYTHPQQVPPGSQIRNGNAKKIKAPKFPSYLHQPTLQRDTKPVIKGNEAHMFSEVAETAVITNLNAKNVGGSRRIYKGLMRADFQAIAENPQPAPKNNISKLYEKVSGKINGGDIENIAGDDEEYSGAEPPFKDENSTDNAEGQPRLSWWRGWF
ncbi:hypothetical protein BDQ12DRAFT_728611 [Crucibulum laeve]|uniref:Uncharacterized protein n=1 Tax=Crucibulum laeve TaxID=68775 RepID=A0A5C3LHD8_9AGAR|nr:hypothetical protein BDQ12DRAFT_728611 [Crucibulum laeve]